MTVMTPGLDLEKLARLQRSLRRNRAALRALQSEARELNDAARDNRRLVVDGMLSTEQWSPTDGFEALLRLPAESLKRLSVNVAAARHSLTYAREAAEIGADIDAITVETNDLARLVKRLEDYVKANT